MIEREIERAVRAALAEDAADRDETTSLLVPEQASGSARVVARSSGIISGQDCAAEVFEQLGGAVWKALAEDGDGVAAGESVAEVSGSIASILSGERTALNFLGHLSGIATLTSRFAAAVAGTGVRILDTRKTIPGLRALQKRAVVHGGGANHRKDLASMILVKENHIAAAGGLGEVSGLLGERMRESEVEVRSLSELSRLEKNPPGRVMLDNFDPDDVGEAVRMLNEWQADVEVEVSGGISLDNIQLYARSGVDYISIGSLTASAPALDLSMLLEDRA